MTYQEFNTYCASYMATTHVVQWGNAQVWKVGGKVFAVGGWEKADGPGITFKTSDLNFEFLRHKEFYRPAPYLASRGMKWIQQYGANKELDEELKYYLCESYRLVSLGLSKKKQKELGLNMAAIN